MHYRYEQARSVQQTAKAALQERFSPTLFSGETDAEWLRADRAHSIGATGLAFCMPICEKIMNEPALADVVCTAERDLLFVFSEDAPRLFTAAGEQALALPQRDALSSLYRRVRDSRGRLDENGEHIVDLKTCPVGSHFAVNLLIGDRTGFDYPLFTTPKSALNAFGAGSFRAGGDVQVLATRYTLSPEENGEPVNRQFYLVEDGKRIFYSMDAFQNVRSAVCRHGGNHSGITYETECGLVIERTIFILPQEEGMPEATELQHITVENRSGRARSLRIVVTGMFGIAPPVTVANDVIFANVVQQSEIVYENGSAVALSLHAKPEGERSVKRFAALLSNGEPMDDFTMSLPAFLGGKTLSNPALLCRLPSRPERNMSPFFAMGKSFTLGAGETRALDSFAGLCLRADREDVFAQFDGSLAALLARYREPGAAMRALDSVLATQRALSSYLTPDTGDAMFDAYVGRALPFQVYYQSFVSRSFAWTQKSYRETGFREIQDLFASMYYLVSAGRARVVRELLAMWGRNIFRAGYTYHDFTWAGKEPGDCSDDQLWFVQAVYRYVTLTNDAAFLEEELPVADGDGTRPIWDTLLAVLTYSGCISVGAHGLPLMDKADWNDTLRLDHFPMKGPEKEALYRAQLEESGEPWGSPLRNTQSESCMNACLLKIAADQIARLAPIADKEADGAFAAELSDKITDSMRRNAWKGGYYARALLNDGREGGYTYLGADGDGLSNDPAIDGTYFLNGYSWPILAQIAGDEQIAAMLERVERHLKTDAGLKLCTPTRFDRLGVNTASGLYYYGDRENGGVFKHAAMMAVTASLKAAKTVADEALAARLAALASFMLDKVLPYQTMQSPFVTKGNPRFCTQYNNSDTGENIGPILSGTASWLTLAVFEQFGLTQEGGKLRFAPVLLKGTSLRYRMNLDRDGTALTVEIESKTGAFRAGGETEYVLDETPCSNEIPTPRDGKEHVLKISL